MEFQCEILHVYVTIPSTLSSGILIVFKYDEAIQSFEILAGKKLFSASGYTSNGWRFSCCLKSRNDWLK